jgi:U2-associated protein SR140
MEEEKQLRQRGVLVPEDRDYLEDMLRDLKPDKNSIGNAMVWCLDHADCAKEISECLYESLDIPETPLHKKVCNSGLI